MSQTQTTFPRWLPLLGGLLGSTTCGLLLYAFSVFIKPLQTQFGWTVTEVALAYSIICLVFGLVSLPAGRISDKVGPRIVVLIGGLIMASGFFLVSTLTPPDPAVVEAGGDALKAANRTPLYMLYLFYGVIAGFGGGCVYLPPIATAPKWWPDKRALATGFTVVGLGLGSFIMGPMATKMIEASGGSALPVFAKVGVAMAIMVVAAALCLKNPPAGYKPAGWNPPAPTAASGPKGYRDYTYEEARRTPQFWLLWLAYFGGSFAGLMVIGLIAKHGIDAMSAAYLAANNLAAGAEIPKEIASKISMNAAYAPSGLAVANAAVRVLIGPLVDKLGGTKKIFLVLFTLQAIALVALFPAGGYTWGLALVAAVIGWNYGAMFTLFPATLLGYYGPTSQGSNYGLLFTAWGIAGAFGPTAGGLLQAKTGSFLVPFIVSAVVLVISVVILATLKAPEKKLAT